MNIKINHLSDDKATVIPVKAILTDEERAHIDELAKRDRILFQLGVMIGNLEIPAFYRRWLSETREFIKDGGVRI